MSLNDESSKARKQRARWTDTQDAYMLSKLVSCKANNMIADGSSFKSSAWTMVTAQINSKFGVSYERQQVKSRYAIVCNYHSIY